MNDEELMAGRLCELAKRSGDGYYVYTDFLGLADISLLHRLARNDERMRGIKFSLFGGYKDAERMIAVFGDEEEFGYPPQYPVKCILAGPKNQKFADRLTHRDYLGALMNLGIGREQIGDIILKDNFGYIFCIEGMAEYIVSSFERVKHTSIACEITDDIPDTESELKEMNVMAASERVDAVSAGVYKLSRNAVLSLVKQGKVFINGIECVSAGTALKEGDKVTVRGYGRYDYNGIVRTTGKNRLVVSILM